MSDKMYQCSLRHTGGRVSVAWIPKEFAQVGKTIQIQGNNEKWDDGWTVTEVYSESTVQTVRFRESIHRQMSTFKR